MRTPSAGPPRASAKKPGLKTIPLHVRKALTAEQSEWEMELLPIERGEPRDEGVELKLIGFSDRELAEDLRKFDTDVADHRPGAEEVAETIRCLKPRDEFARR